MRRFIPIMVFILCINCGTHPERMLKPYNPEKAGATIVNSFDITNKIRFPDLTGNGTSLDSIPYNVAEYNNAIYIIHDDTIYVFDKQTFNKTDEIKLNWPISRSNGFAINAEGNAFLQIGWNNVFNVDLTTGNRVLINDFTIEGYNLIDDNVIWGMGYNVANNSIWFKVRRNYYFFKYNTDDGFIFFEQKGGGDFQLSFPSGIHGSVIWFDGYGYIGGSTIGDVGIWMYNLDNPSEKSHFINVEYLNTLTIPQSSHYDGEHIWLMVERDSRIQMLKLLPHW